MKPSLQYCGTICRQETLWVQNSHLIFLPIQKFSPFQVPEKKYRPFCKSIICRTRSLTNTFAEKQRFSEPCVLALKVKTICKRNAALSLELTRCIFFLYIANNGAELQPGNPFSSLELSHRGNSTELLTILLSTRATSCCMEGCLFVPAAQLA